MSGLILLYSNYSSNSQNIIDKINNNIPFQYVNIDSKEIRNRVLNDKRLNIHCVPCILVCNGDMVDKFEGLDAFSWTKQVLDNIQRTNEPSTPQYTQLEENNPPKSNPKSTPKSKPQPTQTSIDLLAEESQDEEEEGISRPPVQDVQINTFSDSKVSSGLQSNIENTLDSSDMSRVNKRAIKNGKINIKDMARELEKEREQDLPKPPNRPV